MEKSIYLIILIINCISISVFAKDTEKKNNSGIRGGFQSSTLVMDGATPYEANSLNSFYVGFFNENKIVPMLHFGKGLEYFQNGIAYSSNSERILHTLSVPLYFKFKIGPVFALGGAGANFKVSEKFTAGDYEVSPSDATKSNWFDIPVFLGAGVKILFITVDARYHWGLLDVRNGLHSRYFQLGAAVSF